MKGLQEGSERKSREEKINEGESKKEKGRISNDRGETWKVKDRLNGEGEKGSVLEEKEEHEESI